MIAYDLTDEPWPPGPLTPAEGAGPAWSIRWPSSSSAPVDLDEYVDGALQAGARGLLLEDAGAQLLAQVVHAAARGDAGIAPSPTGRLLSSPSARAQCHPSCRAAES